MIVTESSELESLLQEQHIHDPHESISMEADFNLLSVLLGSSVLRSSFHKAASLAQEKGYPIIFLKYARVSHFGFLSQVQYELAFYDVKL